MASCIKVVSNFIKVELTLLEHFDFDDRGAIFIENQNAIIQKCKFNDIIACTSTAVFANFSLCEIKQCCFVNLRTKFHGDSSAGTISQMKNSTFKILDSASCLCSPNAEMGGDSPYLFSSTPALFSFINTTNCLNKVGSLIAGMTDIVSINISYSLTAFCQNDACAEFTTIIQKSNFINNKVLYFSFKGAKFISCFFFGNKNVEDEGESIYESCIGDFPNSNTPNNSKSIDIYPYKENPCGVLFIKFECSNKVESRLQLFLCLCLLNTWSILA